MTSLYSNKVGGFLVAFKNLLINTRHPKILSILVILTFFFLSCPAKVAAALFSS